MGGRPGFDLEAGRGAAWGCLAVIVVLWVLVCSQVR